MRILIAVCLMFMSCLPEAAISGEQPAIVEIVVGGIGRDSDSALKNAFKAAVQQALGSMIDTKTMVENDEVVSDKILSHSGGYVVEYEMLGEPKTEDGLVTVRIKAQVAQKQLMAKMVDEGIVLQEDTSGSFDIKAKVYTTVQDQRSAKEMFAEQIKGYPENYIKVRYADSEPGKKEGEFWVRVEFSSDPATLAGFNADMCMLLDRVAEAPPVNVRYKMEKVNYSNAGPGISLRQSGSEGFWLENFNTISVAVRTNAERTLGSWKRYAVSKELAKLFAESADMKNLIMRITLLDGSGASIREEVFKSALPFVIDGTQIVLNDILTTNNNRSELIPGQNPAILSYKFDDLFPEEVEEISSVRVTLERR